MSDSDGAGEGPGLYFRLFNEIGIIEQLSRAAFQARLPDGVLVSHFAVLNHLVRVADGRTPLELSNAFQLPKTTMSHTLMLLEKRDWIEMRPNPDDKRSKRVWLTDAGRAFREEAIKSLGGEIGWLAEVFPPEEAQALLPGLERLRVLLDARRD
ncbi:MarR family winged helix-turn-helix transcriptional regulator [Gymnodinialimonas hymeniacidonis]|uniref:MarR family winged helix-turn-helix transcriptional regulator n=1 Tax=Gymnodinialimonas hymeniacidonis TaxID=3126508 RepID=UPI0034C5C7EE